MLRTVNQGREVMRVHAPHEKVRSDIEAISGLLDEAFSIARAKVTYRELGGAVECRLFIPDVIQVRGQAARPLIITARVGLPTETEIGAELERHYAARYGTEVGAGKVAKKLKSAVKKVAAKAKTAAHKVAKTKVFKVLKKVAVPLAMVVPGMQPLAAGLAVAKGTKKLVQAAKKGHKGAKKALGPVVSAAKNALTKVNARVTAQLATPKAPTLYLVTDTDGNEEEVTL